MARDNDLFTARRHGLTLQLLMTLVTMLLNSLTLLGILELSGGVEVLRRFLRLILPWAAPFLFPFQLLIHRDLIGSGSHTMPWLLRLGQTVLALGLLLFWWWLGRQGMDFSGAGDWLRAGIFDPIVRSARGVALYEGVMLLQDVIFDMIPPREEAPPADLEIGEEDK